MAVARIGRVLRRDAAAFLVVMADSRVSVRSCRAVVAAAQGGGQLSVKLVGACLHVGIQNGMFLHLVLGLQHLYTVAQSRLVSVARDLVGRGDGAQASGLVQRLLLKGLRTEGGRGGKGCVVACRSWGSPVN